MICVDLLRIDNDDVDAVDVFFQERGVSCPRALVPFWVIFSNTVHPQYLQIRRFFRFVDFKHFTHFFVDDLGFRDGDVASCSGSSPTSRSILLIAEAK